MNKPVVAISLGDPFGIGPEIVVKALADRARRARAHYRVFGCAQTIAAAAESARIDPFWWQVAHDSVLVDAALHHDVLILDYPEFELQSALSAKPTSTRLGGVSSFRWVEDALATCLQPPSHPRFAHALVTAPISKTSWNLSGGPAKRFPGHTELLAERCKAKSCGMLFVGPHLRVMLASIHIPLMSVAAYLTIGKVHQAIMLAAQSCRDMGIAAPRIAVCGLNPHAGESGLLGEEDRMVITPAIELARAQGVNASGPHPGDTIFNAAAAAPFGQGAYDCVVAMYHDQGLIPVKLVDGKNAVNVTVGLPTIRTSPAHGTAFDIAGLNKADPASMAAAIDLALSMITDRARARAG